jgi:hypothetical protein
MRFSWKALIIAPLAIPIIYSVLVEMASPGKSPIFGILFFTALGSVVSYGATVFLFLPSLFVVSRFTPLTGRLTCLLGAVLATVAYLPVSWECYLTSGADSGPPEGSFGHYLRQCGLGWDFWAFPVAGLATAMLYWFLARRPCGKNDPLAVEGNVTGLKRG